VGQPLLRVKGSSEIAGMRITTPNGHIVRVGFNLFQEVSFLLSKGQPEDNAHIPTLEMHIAILRNWILSAGVPIVEIPAVPAGYRFTACLTHDVDFIKIRQHKFDRTLWGFLYRALIASLQGVLSRRLSLHKLLKNYKAVLSLPFVYLGFGRDFWFQFDKYLEIEDDLKSTFFIIPFKGRIGGKVSLQHPERRATHYDITDIKDIVQKLLNNGNEIGLHGIDAWHDTNLANHELKRITDITGQFEIGIRMHWLCFDEYSPKILDEAGFRYDSTFGYNEAIGYRAGTSQVFRPLGARNLLELPLHIQDMALFSPNYEGLTETQAWERCKDLFDKVNRYGGIMTILWHMRSLAPERLWEDFYVKILNELKKRNAWFATASQAVEWFRMRRRVSFENVSFLDNKLRINLKSYECESVPKLMIRVRIPTQGTEDKSMNRKNCIDFPCSFDKEIEISLCELDS
jgi:peptidoglycan/xylan/chitin deacetylase (PgdA/CDA1 family)